MHVTKTFAQLDELNTVAQELIEEAANQHVWLFEGEMGVGKTTLIKALCRAVGVVSVVQSPTYGLVNEYTTRAGESVYHFDCYRLRNEAEAMDIGLEEYLDSGSYCFVEWPERIESLWPTHYYHISLSSDPAGIRTVTTQLK
nr:tRNA threonylcarbamoyladenosine biosynthesis protein TsaE [Fibrella sp. ES10-3-2-2]